MRGRLPPLFLRLYGVVREHRDGRPRPYIVPAVGNGSNDREAFRPFPWRHTAQVVEKSWSTETGLASVIVNRNSQNSGAVIAQSV
jgi:hypothetical protein